MNNRGLIEGKIQILFKDSEHKRNWLTCISLTRQMFMFIAKTENVRNVKQIIL